MDPNQNKNIQPNIGGGNMPPQPGSVNPTQNPQPVVFKPTNQGQMSGDITPPSNSSFNQAPTSSSFPQQPTAQPFVQSQPQPQAISIQPQQPQRPNLNPQFGQVPIAGGNNPGFIGGSTGVNFENPKRKKQLIILAGIIMFILLSMVGFVFGYYMPNKPENVFKKGVSNTGKAIVYVADKYTSDEQLSKLEKSEFKSDLKAKFQENDFTGSFNGVFDSKKLTADLKFESKSGSTTDDLSIKTKSVLPDNSTYPNVFLQMDGSLVNFLDFFVPGASSYKGKWISIDSKYLEELAAATAQTDSKPSEKSQENITREDVAELAKTTANVTNEFIFATDPSKAVLENRLYVGKEKEDDISTYHYEVGFNKKNAQTYCKEINSRIYDLNIAKKIESNDQSREKAKKSAVDRCDKDVEESLKDDPTFDMWIDKSSKAIYKVRFSSKETDEPSKTKAGSYKQGGNTSYVDFGQRFKGSDNLSFFIKAHSDRDKSDWSFNYDINGKDITTKGELKYKNEGGEINATFETKPFNGEIDVNAPKDTVDIREVLKKFGYDPLAINSEAKNSSYKTDINAIYAGVEVYFAENGTYPTLAQINDSGFRSQHMSNLEASVFSPDDDNSDPKLISGTSEDQYTYKASGCNSSGCQKVTLVAVLSDGSKYTKKSLN